MNIMDLVYIVLAVLLVVIIIVLVQYNGLIKLQNRVKKSKANIEIYLNKRFDLIPNLVEVCKGYSNYESDTLEEIVALRANYKEQKKFSIGDVERMHDRLNQYLAIVESYPDLKANSQYLNLQKELRDIEDQLEAARRIYNDDVTEYNTRVETVPSNIVAKLFAFEKTELFQIDNAKRENVNVEL